MTGKNVHADEFLLWETFPTKILRKPTDASRGGKRIEGVNQK